MSVESLRIRSKIEFKNKMNFNLLSVFELNLIDSTTKQIVNLDLCKRLDF